MKGGSTCAASLAGIFGDTSDAPAMVEALKWICEELLMTEAVRVILYHASERNRVLSDRDSCASMWWEKYVKLPGVGRLDEGTRFSRFQAVVASCLGSDECSVVWTGVPGKSCEKDANCNAESCDGKHVGLAVAHSKSSKATRMVLRQLGVVFNHQQLVAWSPSAIGKGKITHKRAELIRSFLQNANNIVEISDELSVYMSGAYGFAQHSCAASLINVKVTRSISSKDSNGHEAPCGFQLCQVECELEVENGRLAWNYGEAYSKRLRRAGCNCSQCK